jgi:hypothetical protein
MDVPKPNKRRWFRFSLRTMFVLMTVGCVWLGYSLDWIMQRREFLAEQDKRFFTEQKRKFPVQPRDADTTRAPLGLWLLGESGVGGINLTWSHQGLRLPTDECERKLQKTRKLFPESTIRVWYYNADGDFEGRLIPR